MSSRSVILALIISLGLVLAMTATSLATTIDFSGSSSVGTDPTTLKALKAVVDFELTGDSVFGTLTITVTNNSLYDIAEVYFNLSDMYIDNNMTDLAHCDDNKLTPQLNTGIYSPYADYGTFNVMLDIDKKDQGVKSGDSTEFQVSLFGYGFNTFTVEDLLQADEANPIAVLWFTKGPEGDDVYAAPVVVGYEASSTAVPEPSTILLFGSGLVGLAGLSRKKVFIKE